MNEKQKSDTIVEEVVPETVPELVDEFSELAEFDVENLLPTMTVSNELMETPEKECIVSDEDIMGLYDEILDDCRNDAKGVDEILANFINMVMNDGDASSASKEAIVNLWKIKSDISDKKAKVADLKTRIKLKEKDTYPRYLAAQQNNKITIEGSKREMIKTINKLSRKDKK